jgi:two-component sensor histidine kinase
VESTSRVGPSTLRGVLTQIFAPYGSPTEQRILVDGDDPVVDDRSATPLALLFHEMATNAAKYGALSLPGGRVMLTIGHDGEDIRLDWREDGGPVVESGAREGFGSRLMALSVERQLGGRMVREWRREGLSISLWIPARSMHRPEAGKA